MSHGPFGLDGIFPPLPACPAMDSVTPTIVSATASASRRLILVFMLVLPGPAVSGYISNSIHLLAPSIDKLGVSRIYLPQCANRASPTRGKGSIPPVFISGVVTFFQPGI